MEHMFPLWNPHPKEFFGLWCEKITAGFKIKPIYPKNTFTKSISLRVSKWIRWIHWLATTRGNTHTLLIHANIQSFNHVAAVQCIKSDADAGQGLHLLVKSNSIKENKCELSESDCCKIVGARQATQVVQNGAKNMLQVVDLQVELLCWRVRLEENGQTDLGWC